MRDIKFRVWDTEHEEWCGADVQLLRGDGDFVTAMSGKDGILEDPTGYSIRPDDTRRFDVQLFTGLKDNNGKEIYEGDIVSWESDYGDEGISQVIWGDGTSDNSYPAFDLDPSSDEEINSLCSLTIAGTIEVIGNIYENPELLEGPK